MEFDKPKSDVDKKENDIIYSKAIKAGKRIYYLDVKKSRNDDMFVAITESKKKISGMDDNLQVTYEKHKIFLYKEDFDKFLEGMEEVIGFVKREQGEYIPPTAKKPKKWKRKKRWKKNAAAGSSTSLNCDFSCKYAFGYLFTFGRTG